MQGLTSDPHDIASTENAWNHLATITAHPDDSNRANQHRARFGGATHFWKMYFLPCLSERATCRVISLRNTTTKDTATAKQSGLMDRCKGFAVGLWRCNSRVLASALLVQVVKHERVALDWPHIQPIWKRSHATPSEVEMRCSSSSRFAAETHTHTPEPLMRTKPVPPPAPSSMSVRYTSTAASSEHGREKHPR